MIFKFVDFLSLLFQNPWVVCAGVSIGVWRVLSFIYDRLDRSRSRQELSLNEVMKYYEQWSKNSDQTANCYALEESLYNRYGKEVSLKEFQHCLLQEKPSSYIKQYLKYRIFYDLKGGTLFLRKPKFLPFKFFGKTVSIYELKHLVMYFVFVFIGVYGILVISKNISANPVSFFSLLSVYFLLTLFLIIGIFSMFVVFRHADARAFVASLSDESEKQDSEEDNV